MRIHSGRRGDSPEEKGRSKSKGRGKERGRSSSKGSSSSSSSRSGSGSKSSAAPADADGVVVVEEDKPAVPTAREIADAAAAEMAVAHAKLGIKELKELLTAAGMSFAGATEKEDLVRLLTKARVQAAHAEVRFVATETWQKVPDGASLPTGLEVKFDLKKGANYARLPAKKK